VMIILTLGPFMMAFAVVLGASNFVVGIIGAIGPLAQIVQIPAVYLVERVGMRKLVVLLAGLVSRLAWVFVATIPLWVPREWRIEAFLAALLVHFWVGSIGGCAFSSWIRDVIPDKAMSSFFSKRMALATATGSLVSLLGAAGIDTLKQQLPSEEHAYAVVFAVGAVAGLFGLYFLGRIPEPRMHSSLRDGFLHVLKEPFRDANFRKLNIFLALWSLAVNFSAPFFTVYMLRRLGLSMTWVLGFSVVSQVMNVLFFRLWGRLTDRFNNKSVINVAGPLFLLCFGLWPLVSMFGGPWMLAFVAAFHIVTGIAAAGVGLAATNLTLLNAPRGRATAYLAVSTILQGLAATIAPVLAGLAADTLEDNHLRISVSWLYEGASPTTLAAPMLDLWGLDFLFLITFVFGLYAVHRLLAVHEEGDAEPRVVQQEFLSEVERRIRSVSTVAGVRFFSNVTLGTLGRLGRRVKENEPPEVTPPTSVTP
jgi:MFS family permease